MKRSYWFLVALSWHLHSIHAEETPKETADATPKPPEDDFDVANEDWGTYYDPQNVFCGEFDCYKILGFDYESYGRVKPDKKTITKRYRRLGREWHPDKSKHKNAKERFVKIARAYEVLTNQEVRAEYDKMRYDQEAYFQKYGTSVLWSYAPQSDVTLVLLALFVLGNVASWYMQKHRWQMVATRLTKAAVEDWSPSMGGSNESKQLREQALEILAKREESTEVSETPATSSPSKASKKGSKGKQKVSMKEKKQKEQVLLEPIVVELVNEMKDFGGGFHQPTWEDLLIVGLVKLPFRLAAGTWWQLKYTLRRLQKLDLSEEEKEILTERAVGPVSWDVASDEDRVEMIKRELWIKENLLDWKEEQEIKSLSAADQKYYMKMKKKGKVE